MTEQSKSHAQYGHCGSCGALIIWAINTTTGKRAPIDAEPNARGNVVLSADKRSYSVVVRALSVLDALPDVSAAERAERAERAREDAQQTWYTNHFQTCPNAQTYRKRGSTR